MHPLLILALGICAVIFLIAALRVNTFLALLTSAILVSLLAPGATTEKISRVAVAFGTTAGNIGIVIAQGSTTVAMITASAMIAAMLPNSGTLGYPRVLLATAIGGGSMIGTWMNDSGFWIYVKMTSLTEVEGLKTWTPLMAAIGLATVLMSLALALVLHRG